jgi:hypothetical protein
MSKLHNTQTKRRRELAGYMAVMKSLNGMSFSPDMPRLPQVEKTRKCCQPRDCCQKPVIIKSTQ